MTTDEALRVAEEQTADIEIAAQVLAVKVRELRAENEALSILLRRAARYTVFWRGMWRVAKDPSREVPELPDGPR